MKRLATMINDNPGISKAEMALRMDRSEKTIQRIIASLLRKDVIIRVGSNKTGYWKTNDVNLG